MVVLASVVMGHIEEGRHPTHLAGGHTPNSSRN